MLKKCSALLLLFCGMPWICSAQIPLPARVGGTLTVNEVKITDNTDTGYLITILKPDGTPFDPPAEDTDGLEGDIYLINIPIFHNEQPGGANPGDDAVIHVTFNGKELNIISPAQGKIKVGDQGSIAQININAKKDEDKKPPVADAGEDQHVNAKEQVTLDGSGSSDPDGVTISYKWRQVAGENVLLSDDSVAKPSFTAPDMAATLEFMLTVTDQDNLTDSDNVIVVVTKADKIPPIANAGPNRTVREGEEVTLDGTNSTDPDHPGGNGIEHYLWKQISGTTNVIILDPTAAKTSFRAPDVGFDGESYVFELVVQDGDGLTDTDQVTINVISENHPPVADAGNNLNVRESEKVILDGSASFDPDNGDGVISYQWKQIAGTSVSLKDASSSLASFTAPPVSPNGEALTFELTVKDKGGLQDTDTVTINVVSTDNNPPKANAGENQVVKEGELVKLDASGSHDDDGNIALYIWSQLGGTPVTLSNPKDIHPSFVAPDVGPDGMGLVFELTVVDNGGLQDTARVLVHVSYVGIPPVADAGPDLMAKPRQVVRLDGSGSNDPDGQIISYTWGQIDGEPVTLSDAAAVKPTFTAPDTIDNKDLLFELTVTDNDNLKDRDEVRVTVSGYEGEDMPLIADAGPDRSFDEGSTGVLDGTASKAGSSKIVSYNWRQTHGPLTTINEPGKAKTTFFVPAVENNTTYLEFELRVKDENGFSDTDSVIINIKDFGQGPGDKNNTCFINTITSGI